MLFSPIQKRVFIGTNQIVDSHVFYQPCLTSKYPNNNVQARSDRPTKGTRVPHSDAKCTNKVGCYLQQYPVVATVIVIVYFQNSDPWLLNPWYQQNLVVGISL